MEETEALDFFDRVTQGTKNSQTITLEHKSGRSLSGVELHIVGKRKLASVISELPDEMFEAVDETDDPEMAEEKLEEQGGSLNAVSEETVSSFERLCKESLDHPELTKPQMDDIVEELNFEVLFELGTEIINMSSEETGSVKSFHKQG